MQIHQDKGNFGRYVKEKSNNIPAQGLHVSFDL